MQEKPTKRELLYQKGQDLLGRTPSSIDSSKFSVMMPTHLRNQWRNEKKQGVGCTVSEILTAAVNFGLNGPHPYENPLEGVKDAFATYERNQNKESSTVKSILEKIAKLFNLEITIK